MTGRQVIVCGSRVTIRVFVLLNLCLSFTGVTTKWITVNMRLTKKRVNSLRCSHACFKKQSPNICNKVLRCFQRLQGSSVGTADHVPETKEYGDGHLQLGRSSRGSNERWVTDIVTHEEAHSLHTLGKSRGIFVGPVFLNAKKKNVIISTGYFRE